MITTPAITQQTTASVATEAPAASSSVLSSDFETFLKMLTAQAQYQDPLEPIDSSEYAAQLAQFSMVEQQVQSNELLSALAAQLASNNMVQMAQMSNWIGMEARTVAPVDFDGSPVTLYPNPAARADEVALVVYDESGAEIDRRSIPASIEPIEWDGLAEDGTPYANGTYSFAVESSAEGEVILTDPAETYARVTETRMQADGQTVLILEGGAAILASDVTGLREPPALVTARATGARDQIW